MTVAMRDVRGACLDDLAVLVKHTYNIIDDICTIMISFQVDHSYFDNFLENSAASV